jgi:hypothetical protein
LSLWWMSEVTRPARAPAAKPPIRASTGGAGARTPRRTGRGGPPPPPPPHPPGRRGPRPPAPAKARDDRAGGRRPGRKGALDGQIGKIENSKADKEPEGHDPVDQALDKDSFDHLTSSSQSRPTPRR